MDLESAKFGKKHRSLLVCRIMITLLYLGAKSIKERRKLISNGRKSMRKNDSFHPSKELLFHIEVFTLLFKFFDIFKYRKEKVNKNCNF